MNKLLWLWVGVILSATMGLAKPASISVGANTFCALVTPEEKNSGAADNPSPQKQVLCWGKSGKDSVYKPLAITTKLEAPTEVVVGTQLGLSNVERDDYACANDRGKLKCWGWSDQERGRKQPESLSSDSSSKSQKHAKHLNDWFKNLGNIELISASLWDFCVFDTEKKLACASNITRPVTKISKTFTTHAQEVLIALDVGTLYACGITRDLRTVCWGGPEDLYLQILGSGSANDGKQNTLLNLAQTKPSFLEKPAPAIVKDPNNFEPALPKVSVGTFHACWSYQGKAACWGVEHNGEVTLELNEVDQIVAGPMKTCFVSKGVFKCAGVVERTLTESAGDNSNFGLELAFNKEDAQIHRRTCVATDQHIHCMGTDGPKTTVKASTQEISLADLEKQFTRYAARAYEEKDIIFTGAARAVAQVPMPSDNRSPDRIDARVFVMSKLKLVVDGIDSPYFTKYVHTPYDRMDRIYRERYHAEDLTRLRRPMVMKITIQLLETVLEAFSKTVILEPEKKQIGDYLVEVRLVLGKLTAAMASSNHSRGLNEEEYRRLGEVGKNKIRDIINRLAFQKRYAGIAALAVSLVEHLGVEFLEQ